MATISVRALKRIARQTLPRALADASGARMTSNVYVAVDASRPPGRELAVQVIAEHENVSESDARRAVEDRVQRGNARGVPYILTAIISVDTLFALASIARARRALRRWLAVELPPSHYRVAAIAGTMMAMEFAPIRSTAPTSVDAKSGR